MIDLYTAATPNGWKISVMLEECELPYRAHFVDLAAGEQFRPEFQSVSPNGRIPAIVDNNPADGGPPLAMFESGAILLYLAEKARRFLSTDPRERAAAMQWLFWQVGGFGPMLGQHGHFKLYAPDPIPYAIERYRNEALRLYGVLELRLRQHAFVAGRDYSIADMSIFPWVQTHTAQAIGLDGYPAVRAWYDLLKARPSLWRGMDVGRRSRAVGP